MEGVTEQRNRELATKRDYAAQSISWIQNLLTGTQREVCVRRVSSTTVGLLANRNCTWRIDSKNRIASDEPQSTIDFTTVPYGSTPTLIRFRNEPCKKVLSEMYLEIWRPMSKNVYPPPRITKYSIKRVIYIYIYTYTLTLRM